MLGFALGRAAEMIRKAELASGMGPGHKAQEGNDIYLAR